MKEQFRNIKGTFDVLPYESRVDGSVVPESVVWQYVESVIRRVMLSYGFGEIRTPVLEQTELIARGVGESTDIVSKEMFAFERGDNRYVLRPEITAPVMRAYLQHHMDQQSAVQKLFYLGPCFRAERPQKGRYRQFHQFGCEVIGTDRPTADAEAICVMIDIYRTFGIENMVLLLNTLGDEESRPRYRKALVEYFEPYTDQLSQTAVERLETNPLRMLDTKVPEERELLKNAPRLFDFIDEESKQHFADLKTLLGDLGIEFREDPLLVRGLDYYTRTAFELVGMGLGAQNALAGGGRYDLLAREVGSKRPVPAVGFAAGMERLFLALQDENVDLPTRVGPDLYLVSLGPIAQRWVVPFVRKLRSEGLMVEYDLQGRSAKAQLREANRLGARYVVVVGDDELHTGSAKLKAMSDGSESTVAIADESLMNLIDRIRND